MPEQETRMTPGVEQLQRIIRTHKFTREEFPIPCVLPSEICDQIDELIASEYAKAEAPIELKEWMDTVLWSFVHGALLNLGLVTGKETVAHLHDQLHQDMRGAIVAAFKAAKSGSAGTADAEPIDSLLQSVKAWVETGVHPVMMKIGLPQLNLTVTFRGRRLTIEALPPAPEKA